MSALCYFFCVFVFIYLGRDFSVDLLRDVSLARFYDTYSSNIFPSHPAFRPLCLVLHIQAPLGAPFYNPKFHPTPPPNRWVIVLVVPQKDRDAFQALVHVLLLSPLPFLADFFLADLAIFLLMMPFPTHRQGRCARSNAAMPSACRQMFAELLPLQTWRHFSLIGKLTSTSDCLNAFQILHVDSHSCACFCRLFLFIIRFQSVVKYGAEIKVSDFRRLANPRLFLNNYHIHFYGRHLLHTLVPSEHERQSRYRLLECDYYTKMTLANLKSVIDKDKVLFVFHDQSKGPFSD